MNKIDRLEAIKKAKEFKSKFNSYNEARKVALKTVINPPTSWQPSNYFVDVFWETLKSLY